MDPNMHASLLLFFSPGVMLGLTQLMLVISVPTSGYAIQTDFSLAGVPSLPRDFLGNKQKMYLLFTVCDLLLEF